MYINDLAQDIKRLNCGVRVAARNVSILLFADDIVLLASNAVDMQRMLNAVHNWGQKWRLCINEEKTKIVHYRQTTVNQLDVKFKCGTFDVLYTDNYKYLGLWFDQFLDFKAAVKIIAKSASRALGALFCKCKSIGGMSYDTFTKLYNSLIVPILTYGAGIWGHSIKGVINTVQNKACKYFLGVGKFASNDAVRRDMGWMSCHDRQKLEIVGLWCRFNNMSMDRITRNIFDWSNGLERSGTGNRVRKCKELFITLNVDNIYDTSSLLDRVKAKVVIDDQDNWYNNFWNDKNKENGNN